MAVLLLSVCAGMCLLVLPGAVPAIGWPVPALVLGGALASWILAGSDPTLRRGLRNLAPLLFLAGFCHAALMTSYALDRRLPDCSDADFRAFTLEVTSTPEILRAAPDRGGRSDVRFEASVRHIAEEPACAGLGSHRVRLTWYAAPPIARGEIWRVRGKLRPPWGYRNPGGFDYERWLFGKGLHGSGYVREGHLLHPASVRTQDVLRTRLSGWLTASAKTQSALMHALLLGDDSRITDEQWQRLRDSGLIHVVVVSGLHVGIVAGAGFWLGLILSRLMPPLLRRYGSRRLATPVALIASGAYVQLTGAGLPSQRAWLLCAMVLMGLAGSRRLSLSSVFGWVLLVLLAVNPLSLHQQGFWLSFLAVAVLLTCFVPSRRFAPAGFMKGCRALTRAQLVLGLGLSPAIALLQGAVPVAAPVVNLVVVPLISLAILPLLLLGAVIAGELPALAGGMLVLVDGLLWVVDRVATWGASISPLAVAPVRGWGIACLIAVTAVLLCSAPVRFTPVLLCGWLVWLTHTQSAPAEGSFRLTAFDVGQGSAILVQTRNHGLLFDTGPGFPGGFDLGTAAVVPSLVALGVAELDAVVVSHADTDHSGGLVSILARLPVRQLWSSDRQIADTAPGGVLCRTGESWQWDGVGFRFLHPDTRPVRDDNDGSCVLEITAPAPGGTRALLAGDISRRIESRLLTAGLGTVDLLMAPHHGSRSSSSAAWVARLTPSVLFISAPRRSRYGHPHAEVVARYQSAGAAVYVTGRDGALTWESVEPDRVTRLRERDAAYWRGKPLPAASGGLSRR